MSIFDLFRKKRLPNAGKVVAVAAIGGIPSATDIAGLRSGHQKTCVITLRCGCCEQDWKDAVEPRKPMQLSCPNCGAVNEVTWNFSIAIVRGS